MWNQTYSSVWNVPPGRLAGCGTGRAEPSTPHLPTPPSLCPSSLSSLHPAPLYLPTLAWWASIHPTCPPSSPQPHSPPSFLCVCVCVCVSISLFVSLFVYLSVCLTAQQLITTGSQNDAMGLTPCETCRQGASDCVCMCMWVCVCVYLVAWGSRDMCET